LPFDLVLVNADCVLKRVQVRYATRKRHNIILKLRNSYSSSGGCKTRALDRAKIDGFAISCPDTDRVYYINTYEIPPGVSCEIYLSLKLNARWVATEFMGVDRLFAPVAQPDRASVF